MSSTVGVMMSISEVAGLVVSICSIFVGVILVAQRAKNTMLEETLRTIWKRIDETKTRLDDTEKHIDRNFHDKVAVKEYIDLINAPYLKQMEFINTKLNQLTSMVESLVEKNKRQ